MDAREAFVVLGLPIEADVAAILAARRELAKRFHPDLGGDADAMQQVNEAVTAALAAKRRDATDVGTPGRPPGPRADPSPNVVHADHPMWSMASDRPSFTVDALPVACFEALAVVATWIGEVVSDDPPYLLEVLLEAPNACWCRVEILPDAGSSSVGLSIGRADGAGAPPPVDRIRDLWIDQLNRLDWGPFDTV